MHPALIKAHEARIAADRAAQAKAAQEAQANAEQDEYARLTFEAMRDAFEGVRVAARGYEDKLLRSTIRVREPERDRQSSTPGALAIFISSRDAIFPKIRVLIEPPTGSVSRRRYSVNGYGAHYHDTIPALIDDLAKDFIAPLLDVDTPPVRPLVLDDAERVTLRLALYHHRAALGSPLDPDQDKKFARINNLIDRLADPDPEEA